MYMYTHFMRMGVPVCVYAGELCSTAAGIMRHVQ